MDPISMLPEEVWRLIIDKLSTLDDLLRAYNTCSLWRSFLSPNRTQWLFQAVFPIVEKYLPKSDLLACRQVCKSWNKVIDFHLENDQPAIIAPGGVYKQTCRKRPRSLEVDLNENGKRLKMSPTEAVENFQTQFSAGDMCSVKNLFVSRSLNLCIGDINVTVLKFFEKFGFHLQYLNLTIFQSTPAEIISPIEVVKFIWNILRNVPNLKKLVLPTMQDIFNNPEMIPSDEERDVQMQEVVQFLENNPAPPLPKLHNLEVDVDVPLINRVLESAYAQQLTKYVHITPRSFVPPNLTNLTDLVWHFTSGYPLDQLNNLKNLSAPSLQHLDVYVTDYGMNEDNPSSQQLFEAIETFGSSLTQLFISWKHFEPNFHTQLNLPFVQEVCLEIEECPNPESLNLCFLHSLKSLRKLSCIFWQASYECFMKKEKFQPIKETVDLHYFLNEITSGGPYKSNIWDLLPSLDVIEIQVVGNLDPPTVNQTKIYTRVEKV